jgi:hypothetical protein
MKKYLPVIFLIYDPQSCLRGIIDHTCASGPASLHGISVPSRKKTCGID